MQQTDKFLNFLVAGFYIVSAKLSSQFAQNLLDEGALVLPVTYNKICNTTIKYNTMRTAMIERITGYGIACFLVGSGNETKSIERWWLSVGIW